MMSESRIEYPYRSAMRRARWWVSTVRGAGSVQKDAEEVEGAANFLPALVKLAPRPSDELVQDLN
jgi:hypothetical protein